MNGNQSSVKAMLEKISRDNKRRVVEMYFVQGVTNLAEIGRKVGYTRERVRQIVEEELENRKKK